MPNNNIAFARNYTSVIDEVYQRASVSGVLNSGRRMVRAGHNAKEILIGTVDKSAVSFDGMLTNPTHIQRMNNSAWAWSHFYCAGKLTVTGTCTPDLSRKAIACGRMCTNAHYQTHAAMPWYDARCDLRECEFLADVGVAVASIDYWFYDSRG